MKRTFSLFTGTCLAFLGACLITSPASGQTVTFDFQDGTDQGFGTGFGNDASKAFPIVSIGGSLRMEVTLGGFQVGGRQSQGVDAFLAAMNTAVNNPAISTISYDWYVDTSLSPGNYGTFMQFGTYINSGNGAYAQDFPGTGKDVELNGTQLASGQIFSGTVTESLSQKYGVLSDPNWFAQSFMRFGLIMNGDGSQTLGKVYFDNITVTGVPEPSSLSLLALAAPAFWMMRRRKA